MTRQSGHLWIDLSKPTVFILSDLCKQAVSVSQVEGLVAFALFEQFWSECHFYRPLQEFSPVVDMCVGLAAKNSNAV